MFENPRGDTEEMIAHEERLKALLQDTLSKILGKEQPVPSALFHYTNESGLLGILDSGEVRATHQEFMNDPSETEHATTVAEQLVNDKFFHDERAKHTFLQRIGVETSAIWNGEFHADAYVASFSEIGDSLSQWRAYASDGRGYCLGVDPTASLYGQRLDSFEAGTAFFKVTYGEATLRERLDEFLQHGMALVEQAVTPTLNRQGALNRLANWFQLVVQLSRRVSKQLGYEEEREWRLVHVRQRTRHPYDTPDIAEVKFKTARGQVVPYVSLKLSAGAPQLPLHSVCLGPAAIEAERELALRMLLSSKGYDPRVIRRSATQYRG